MKKFFKKLKKKRCKDCKYLFKTNCIFACYKSKIYIEPVKLICFKRRTKDDEK